MNDFLTWPFLATFAGAALATGIITQFIKGLFAKLPTQLLSYFIALAVLLAATAATAGVPQPWTVWAMTPLNAVLVSLAANGGHSAVTRIAGGGK